VISINLSGTSLDDMENCRYVIDRLEETGVPATKVCFEITETAAMANLENARVFLDRLRKRGCRISLDDFGAGFSSFAYLKNLPVDYLKIDGMFIKSIVDDAIDFAMVKSINDIGHAMGKRTIAEFVENDAIVEKLREIGVDYAQGYGIAKPEPFEDVLR
ncbi:MAG TPA: EAL domain-containing protein, partial [Opitutaceae bacterium]